MPQYLYSGSFGWGSKLITAEDNFGTYPVSGCYVVVAFVQNSSGTLTTSHLPTVECGGTTLTYLGGATSFSGSRAVFVFGGFPASDYIISFTCPSGYVFSGVIGQWVFSGVSTASGFVASDIVALGNAPLLGVSSGYNLFIMAGLTASFPPPLVGSVGGDSNYTYKLDPASPGGTVNFPLAVSGESIIAALKLS